MTEYTHAKKQEYIYSTVPALSHLTILVISIAAYRLYVVICIHLQSNLDYPNFDYPNASARSMHKCIFNHAVMNNK